MSSVSTQEIKREFLKSKLGLTGIFILSVLILISIITISVIPASTFQEWNNPEKWISYPKTSVPSWVNYLSSDKIPEHKIIDAEVFQSQENGIFLTSQQFGVFFDYDDFPSDFIFEIKTKYTDSHLVQIKVIRPDGITLELLSTTLPHSDTETIHSQRYFSTDNMIKKNLNTYKDDFEFDFHVGATEIIFSELYKNQIQKGNYIFIVDTYGIEKPIEILESKMVLGGKAYGLMGTDELRRDLAIGLLLGSPLALFIGISVSMGSVVVGLIYGVYSGYKGNKTDEAMMRFNDVIYALPALPFLIILAVTISNSIFLMIGFLMIFSWVGIAKVSRSMSLQIKTRQYIEAAKIMGQKDSKIIFRHILPQLLPYAFASIAISVPAAITTEAGLSFLGLGDPSFPTWGQILHDANTYGAAAQGFWWWIVPPGILIAITGLAFVFIGNALDAIVNPKLKR
ncbi:MAG: ABC transporter permease [Crenarchaeota archaeon]|nr:ABC transporter permease [Thermoproteota archaeon]MDA1124745.1 ABC transporter permease [Thermoproteota archaeon]